MNMSKILSNAVASTTSTSSECETHATTPSPRSDSQNTGKQSMALFSGAVIQGVTFNQHKHPASVSYSYNWSIWARIIFKMEAIQAFRFNCDKLKCTNNNPR